ncbi:MAG: sortase [Anaerolineae bacterium]|nr:sortase [Anaerolineae bacterium]
MPFAPHRFPRRVSARIVLMVMLVLVTMLIPGTLIAQARPLQAATPSTSASIPGEVMLGESFTFDITFKNSGGDEGYGPFIDVVLPYNNGDGVDFNASTGATYLGQKLDCSIATFNNQNKSTHPFAKDTSGNPIVVTGPTGSEGDKLVACKLPFGSFVPSQPDVKVTYNATMSASADPSTALTFRSRGGFQFGEDPLDNWCCDAVKLNPSQNTIVDWPGSNVNPTLIKANKTMTPSIGSEFETATGPNYISQYTISVDIADGQTIDSLQITETLDGRIQFKSVGSISPSGSCSTIPSTTIPGGTLVCDVGSVTGGSGSNDASVTFSFYIPDKNASSNDILTPNVGGCNGLIPNTISVTGNWGSTPQTASDTDTTDHEFYACAAASQKGKNIVNDVAPTGVSPGDTIEYSLNFQISDYFSVEDITLDDVFSDGQLWDATFTPTMTLTEHGSTTSGNMAVSSYSITRDTGTPGTSTGETTVIFNITDELTARGLDIKVLGGCVPAGGGTYDCSGANNKGSTTGVITFRTVVQDEFTDAHLLAGNSGDKSIDQGDVLKNEVTTEAEVLDNTTLLGTTKITKDAKGVSEVEVTLERGTATKSFYAINGNTAYTTPVHVAPADVITYKLKYDLATSDFEDLYFTDFLPLPVLDVDDPKADGSAANWPASVTNTCAAGTVPVAGNICFSSADTFYAYASIIPTVTPDSGNNTLKIDYGDFDDPRNQATVIELLFSIAVNTQPFTDGLTLTNQATVHEGSTQNSTSDSSAIIDFVLDEPVLVSKKSVIATDNANATMDPALTAYTFTAPGSAGARWTLPSKIDSTYLKNNPINSNINGADGGDIITFAIVIENQGHSSGGAYDITILDSLPSELQIPSGGLNLDIRFGDGTGGITYTKPDGTAAADVDLFGGGIKLDDPGTGLCQTHDPNLGNNIIIITYDLQVKPAVASSVEITNSGTITNYSNKEGGDDFTGSGGSGQEGDLKDQAKIKISDPAIAKSITTTSIAATGTAEHRATIEDLTIGEEVTFEIVVTLPEGNSTAVTVTDNLPTSPAGILSVLSSCVTSVGSNLTLTNNPTGTCPTSFGTHNNTDADAYNDQVVFDFGDVTNTVDGVENDKDQIVLQVVAKVEGEAANQDGDQLANEVSANTGSNTQTGSADFDIVVPILEISGNKTDGSDYFAPSGLLVYGISYQNTGTGPATGVVVTETIPGNTTFDLANSSTGWVLPGSTNACPDNAAAGTVCEYPLGQVNNGAGVQTIHFAVEVDNPLATGVTQITNNASIADEFNYSTGTATDTNELANLGKSILDTNQTFTAGNDVAIGELVTYRVVLYIPPHDAGGGAWSGLMPNLTVTDDLDAGLAFVDCLSVTPSSLNLTTDLTGDFAAACTPDTANPQNGNPAIYPIPQTGTGSSDDVNQGRRVLFDLGNVTNSGAVNETITIEYRVAVLDSVDNLRGVGLNNTAVATWKQNSTQNESTVLAPDVTIVEPWYYLIKRADQTVVFKGATITFTIEVGHRSESDADGFDAVLSDPLPDGLHYLPGTLRIANGWDDRGTAVINDNDPTNLRVTWNNFPLGQTAFVEFQAFLGPRVREGIENTAYLAWTSLPGDVTAAQSPFNPLSTERFYDPPSSIDIYGVSSSLMIIIRGNTLPETGFAPGEVTVIEPDVGFRPYTLDDAIWLEIPAHRVHVPVVGIPLTEQGWNLTWLSEQAGYLGGTAYPTWLGNTALTAHAYLSDGSPGPFIAIDQLKWGDPILLRTSDATYVYEVRQSYYVEPDDLSPLRVNDGYDWLTLITCHQYDEAQSAYRWRMVVRAVLVDVIDNMLDRPSP